MTRRNSAGVDFDAAPALVWQMGKVGSMSIHAALLNAGVSAVHVHVLNPVVLAERRKQRADKGLPPTMQHQEADRLQPLLADPGVGFRVVSAVRDPIAQALSSVFQRWEEFPPRPGVDKDDPDEVADWFVRDVEHFESLGWFEREVEQLFGVDVYAAPFDRASKTLTVNTGRIKLVVLRCEDDNAVKNAALNKFFARADLRLSNLNAASGKAQGTLYEQVRERLRLPPQLVERYLSSRLVRHFYEADDIDRFRRSWTST